MARYESHMVALRIFILVLLSGMASTTLASTTQAEHAPGLPLDRSWHGLPQIAVTLNGGFDANFIVDTAATKTMLTDAIIGRLGLWGRGVEARVSGSTGSAATRRFSLASLRLGAREFRQVDAFRLPNAVGTNQIGGLIGADILRSHVVEFDFSANRLRLLGTDAEFGQDGGRWIAIPFRERMDGLLIVSVTIGPVHLPALLDTGASQTIMNHAAARAIGLHLFPDSASREPIGGASGHVQNMHQIQISQFSLGDFAIGWSRIGVADLAIFEAVSIGDRPAMLLSAAAFSDRRFIIDYPRDRLLIQRNPT